MASTPEGRRLTQAHQRELLRIKALAIASLMQINPDLDWVQFEKVWPDWVSFAYRICAENRRGAALLTAAYLRRHRIVEGVPGEVVPTLAEALDRAMFEASMNATMRKRLMDAAYKSSLMDDPAERRAYLQAERRRAIDDAAGAFGRHVLNGSRETAYRTSQRDHRALGYARVLVGDKNCAFCAMLASRGPDYKSKESAKFTGTTRRRGTRPPGMRYHDWCDCGIEVVYSDDYEMLGNAGDLYDLWTASTRGLSGKAAFNAFRQAYEAEKAP